MGSFKRAVSDASCRALACLLAVLITRVFCLGSGAGPRRVGCGLQPGLRGRFFEDALSLLRYRYKKLRPQRFVEALGPEVS